MTWTTRQRSDLSGLAAIVAGDGPTMVLIHGVGLQADAWGAQLDALCDCFRMIAVDMPGHGDSPCLDTPAGLEDYSDRIARAIEADDTGPAVIVGHSFGAMIALDLAIRHPHLVTGVSALNAIYRRTPDAQAAVLQRAQSLDGVLTADPDPTLDRWFGTEETPARAACRAWLNGVDPIGYRAAYGVFATEDGPLDQDLRRLPCPALFMTGGQEPNSTPAMSEAMAALASKGQSVVIEDAAHMMPMTHGQNVSAVLRQFAQGCLP